jgi:hypothetical protein
MQTTIDHCTCPNCDGTGKLPHYSHIANGDCFACGGTGTIVIKSFIGPNSDVILDVEMLRGEFWHAWLRCRTWKLDKAGDGNTYKTWGKDKWCVRIDDIEKARFFWKKSKSLGIITSLLN